MEGEKSKSMLPVPVGSEGSLRTRRQARRTDRNVPAPAGARTGHSRPGTATVSRRAARQRAESEARIPEASLGTFHPAWFVSRRGTVARAADHSQRSLAAGEPRTW